jgi:hypothetical protein
MIPNIMDRDGSRVKNGGDQSKKKKWGGGGGGPELKKKKIQPKFFFLLELGGTMATTGPPKSVTDYGSWQNMKFQF